MKKTLYDFFKKYLKEKDGATAIEFGMLAIPFLLVILGTMETGRMVWMMNSVQYAIEETSRYASLNSNLPTSSYQTYAEEKLQAIFVSPESLQITSSTATSNGIDFIEVTATYQLTSLFNDFIPGGYGAFSIDSSAKKPVIN